MKTYISGKITGLELSEAFDNFKNAENHLNSNGHNAINVMEIFRNIPNWTWKDYMIADIKELLECESIFMLSNWRDSKGATIENSVAKGLGLTIIYSCDKEGCYKPTHDLQCEEHCIRKFVFDDEEEETV